MDWTGAHKRFCAGDTERQRWQNPEKILLGLELKKGDIFVDIGCGEGYFALPAARIVGRHGKVFGVDIDPTAITALKNEATREGLNNMFFITGSAEEVIVCEGCADLIFFGIDLHDFRDPEKVLRNARKMVKPFGRLADLDWRKQETPFGPPLPIRFSEETSSAMIISAGFFVESVTYPGPYHYLITARTAP